MAPSTVDVADTELAIDESTTVTATVALTDGGVGAGLTGIWSEGPAVATVPANVTSTDTAGVSTITFTAREDGQRAVTFTVVNLIGGVVVERAVNDSVTITVSGADVGANLSGTSGFVSWISASDSTAAEVFAGLDSAAVLWWWNGSAWVLFAALPGGAQVPGSTNFDATLGAVLFIA